MIQIIYNIWDEVEFLISLSEKSILRFNLVLDYHVSSFSKPGTLLFYHNESSFVLTVSFTGNLVCCKGENHRLYQTFIETVPLNRI